METKYKVLHFLLVSVLWIAAAMVLTARSHVVPVTGIEFGGEPDFVREAVQEISVLLMPGETP